MIEVALVDDHAVTRKGIKTIIESGNNISVILEASDGAELLDKLGKTSAYPKILIADISMPVMNGFDLLDHLQKKYPAMKVIIFSLFSDTDTIITLINAGASGYLHKSADPLQLLTAIKSVATKGYYVNELVSKENFKQKKISTKNDSSGGHAILSQGEINVIKLCCTDLTYREIARQLNLSPKTIDHHREKIFKKLGVRNRAGLVVYCFRNGLIDIFPGN